MLSSQISRRDRSVLAEHYAINVYHMNMSHDDSVDWIAKRTNLDRLTVEDIIRQEGGFEDE